ncbi:MAG: phosphatidate cytidylyltransferase [Betaproteobacteria bacterium]|jgi:phosphatidate cytidylyltransferase|nr:phosphatidate cytidylyltransferase [Pseudomonadota bacterium]NBO04864.1 phosphatidate cytidylyltransferase [Betaproteobacteria bacterium]HAB48056.1 phosphatidate cytidylyltransferase [Lautropia sp.]NBP34871.1 phosphatidate cytidylyltransferase [Betaproteobacteria bacterium]NBP37541.1 phosphatidate cytidylyltransferase [Betaproteobacteria bacterium]
MLMRRVVTALALLSVLIPALLAPQVWVWACLSFVFVMLAAWEWLRLLEPSRSQSSVFFALLILGAVLLFDLVFQDRHWLEMIVTPVCFVAALLWVVVVPRSFSGRPGQAWLQAWLAWVFLLAAWMALLELHRIDLIMLFSGLALVWIADIAAYFVGKRFGRRKLAPDISPGKTREGAMGACIVVALVGLVVLSLAAEQGVQALPRRWFELLVSLMHGSAALLIVLGLLQLLVILSIIGDLYESQLKRLAGVKDSSNLLPGHGGVFDRIDALVPTLPAIVLIDRWLHWLVEGVAR